MKKTFFASPALALGLAFMAPVLFAFSRNSHMVEPKSMLLASGLVFLGGCLVVLGGIFALRLWGKIPAALPSWLRFLVLIGFCLVLVETTCFFLQTQIHAAIPDPRWLRILVSRIFPFIALFFLVRKFGFYPYNVFLMVFLGISTLNIGLHLIAEEQVGPESSLRAYEIKNRPNIYLFFLESYHSLDMQREIYGIDTEALERYLAENDFVDYGKVYSNSDSTLLSYADTFGFTSSRAYARGNSDATPHVRRMLGGSENNTLFRILKENEYTTVLLTGGGGYYGTTQGNFLDDSDSFISPGRSTLFLETLMCFEMLNSRFRENSVISIILLRDKIQKKMLQGRRISYKGSLEERVAQARDAYPCQDSSLLLVFKGGAEHTPQDGSYTWQQHRNWVQSGRYQGYVERGRQELQRICDKLIADDPGAIIILIGDHAPCRFRHAEDGGRISSPQGLKSRVEEKGIPFKDFIDDRHAVFLAIRLPHGQREDISYGLPMSHVNLFRHVFAYLNNDTGILDSREPSNSYFGDIAIVKEGKPVLEP